MNENPNRDPAAVSEIDDFVAQGHATGGIRAVAADLVPQVMVSHDVYAALLWAIILALWAGYHARHWKQ